MNNQIKPNTNILASIIPLAVLFVLIQAASLIGFFHFSFQAVEKYAIQKILQSSIDSMRMELDRISGVVFEWSAWDDTALFVKGQNPDFIQVNMAEKTLQKQNLNVLGILDAQGKPVWTRCIKVRDNKPEIVDLNLFLPEVLEKNKTLWNHKSPDSCITGYYSTQGGVLMLSSRPITSNDNTGAVCGSMIMGRFIDDNFMTSVTKQVCQDFQWWYLRTDYTRNALKKYLSRITPEHPIYIETATNLAVAYTILPDIEGKDAILIKFATTNNVASFKQGWLAKCSAIYALEGFIFIIYLAAFANKHCTACRTQITQEEDFTPEIQCVSFQQITEPQHSTENLPI